MKVTTLNKVIRAETEPRFMYSYQWGRGGNINHPETRGSMSKTEMRDYIKRMKSHPWLNTGNTFIEYAE